MRAICIAAVIACGACGNVAITCETETCQGSVDSFKICSTTATVTYEFAATSCVCQRADSACLANCDGQATTYCGGTVPSTDFAVTPIQDLSAYPVVTCSTLFQGGAVGTFTPCAVSITYDTSTSVSTIATAGGTIPASTNTWTGFEMNLSGAPMPGTFSQSMSTSASSTIMGTGAMAGDWVASFSSSKTIGTASLVISTLGPGSSSGTVTTYLTPHGTWTGSLVDQGLNKESSVTVTVTF